GAHTGGLGAPRGRGPGRGPPTAGDRWHQLRISAARTRAGRALSPARLRAWRGRDPELWLRRLRGFGRAGERLGGEASASFAGLGRTAGDWPRLAGRIRARRFGSSRIRGTL